jgi:hypothetical protein
VIVRSKCDCLVCRLESSLIAELNDHRKQAEFLAISRSSEILSAFPSAFDLVEHLHGHQNREQNSSSDPVLLELLARTIDPAFGPIRQSLLLLVFIPTIHRTMSQIAATFPSLPRDDTAQYLFTVLLEFLRAKELQLRRSHIAFTIARKIRRSAFRWAIRESRKSLRNEAEATPTALLDAESTDEDLHSHVLLDHFLDCCQHKGWLSSDERQLLTQFKLEHISGPEMARRTGLSVVAIRHRIQRLLDRLRRIARKSGFDRSSQLKLFSR